MAGKRSEVGKIIAKWRIENDHQLKEFAALIGCSSTMVSKVEYGRDPMPPAWLEKLPVEIVKPIATVLREKLRQDFEETTAAIDAAVSKRSGNSSDGSQ